MLDRLSTKSSPAKRLIYTPLKQMALNYALLESSPLEGKELHQFNIKFASKLRYINNMPIQIKRYAKRITVMCETQNTIIALMAQ